MNVSFDLHASETLELTIETWLQSVLQCFYSTKQYVNIGDFGATTTDTPSHFVMKIEDYYNLFVRELPDEFFVSESNDFDLTSDIIVENDIQLSFLSDGIKYSKQDDGSYEIRYVRRPDDAVVTMTDQAFYESIGRRLVFIRTTEPYAVLPVMCTSGYYVDLRIHKDSFHNILNDTVEKLNEIATESNTTVTFDMGRITFGFTPELYYNIKLTQEILKQNATIKLTKYTPFMKDLK